MVPSDSLNLAFKRKFHQLGIISVFQWRGVFMRRFVEAFFRKIFMYLDMTQNDVMKTLRKEAVTSSANFIQEIQKHAQEKIVENPSSMHKQIQFFSDRVGIQRYAMQLIFDKKISEEVNVGCIIELGVDRGRSIRFFSRELTSRSNISGNNENKKFDKKIFGFDTFEGFTEPSFQGIDSWHKFRSNGRKPRMIPKNVELIIGDVTQTLPTWLATNKQPILLVHFDLDVYGATLESLKALKPFLEPTTLLLFDELIGNPGWQSGEYAALCEVFNKSEITYISFGPNQALLSIGMC